MATNKQDSQKKFVRYEVQLSWGTYEVIKATRTLHSHRRQQVYTSDSKTKCEGVREYLTDLLQEN